MYDLRKWQTKDEAYSTSVLEWIPCIADGRRSDSGNCTGGTGG